MTPELTPDEQLLVPILRASDQAAEAGPPAHHPDDELLALFADGRLGGHERAELIEHLDTCVNCRRTAAMLMLMSADAATPVSQPAEPPLHFPPTPAEGISSPSKLVPAERREKFWQIPNRAAVYVLAASLLLAVGVFFAAPRLDPQLVERRTYDKATALLAAKKFTEARELLADAEERGTKSERLRSLRSQAVRELPGPVALAFAGRLSDFGYEPGGIAAREPDAKVAVGLKPAYEILQGAGTNEVEAILNRGHALLALNRPLEALREFQQAAEKWSRDPWVWLGHGMAEFMLDDYTAAEHDFRECLRLDAGNVAAKMNLALTLEELNKRDEAVATWQELLSGSLSEKDRAIAQRAIRQLGGN